MPNPITASVTIDKLMCSAREYFEVIYDFHKVPGYKFIRPLYPSKERNKNYWTVTEYVHKLTGNTLKISNDRRRKLKYASPLYLMFNSSFYNPLSCIEVIPVERFFMKEHNVHLRVSGVHIAVDLISDREIGLHNTVTRSIRAGNKAAPRKIEGTTSYYGKRKSPRQITAYDKASELIDKSDINVKGERSRVEVKLTVTRENNFVSSIEQLAVCDWSFLYPKYFSFHRPNHYLEEDLGKRYMNRPIWQLRKLAMRKLETTSSNFYRDYLNDFKELSEPVRKALATYKWCPNYKDII